MDDSNPEPYKTKKKPYKKREKRPPKKISERYLRNSGMYYLERFTASSGHFKTVMARKINKSCYHHKDQDREECLAMLDKVTEDLLKQGYLDDDGYVRGMVTSLRRAGKSKKAIIAKLAQKRVPTSDIEKALEHFDTENTEDPSEAEFFAAITFARKKRLGPYDEREKYEDVKALAILARNGYSYDTARRVLNVTEDEIYELGYRVY
ncbi:MAG: RecX family transcriptional regulator [Alphaproteobacteria bacterium]|nr:RecX family transcriptional regulator [Alphaproteobacteria bacterium]